MSNEIVDAVRLRGYLQGKPADELGRQMFKLSEEFAEAIQQFGAATAWSRLAEMAGEAGRLHFRGKDALPLTGSVVRLREELADMEVVLQCAWALCGEIDGQDYPLVAAARDKAIGDIVRGVGR